MANAAEPIVQPLNGTRGLHSNVSNVGADPTTFANFVDLYTDQAQRIQKRNGKGAAKGASAGARIAQLHEFTHIASNGTLTYWVIRAFGTSLQYWTGVAWAAMTFPTFTTTSTAVPQSSAWVFLNFGNRVFGVNGKDDMIVFDGTGTAWKLAGCSAPSVAAGYSLAGKYSTGGVSARKGSRYIAGTGVAEWDNSGAWASKYIDINGVRYTISSVDFKRSVHGVSGATLTEAVKEDTTPASTSAGGGTITVTAGGVSVSGVGTTFLAQLAAGMAIRIGSIDGVVKQVISDTSLDLLYGWEGQSGSTATWSRVTYTGHTYSIHAGLQQWGPTSPRYTYAYRNPTSGHVSNRAPITEITQTNVAGETVTLTGIAYSATAFLNGFTEIVIFRSPVGSFTPVKINTSIPNANSGGTTTWTEGSTLATSYLDTALTNEVAPISENEKPPVGLSSIAEYQGRIVGIKPTESRGYFSAAREEIPNAFGNAAECWNANNVRDVTSPTGLIAVGGEGNTDALIVQTARGDFSLDGNDNRTYNLYPLQTRSTGGAQGRAAIAQGKLVQLYGDKRLWDFGLGADLGLPIQDKLDAMNALYLERARAWWFSYQSKNYLIVTGPKTGASTDNDYSYVFDYDKGEWYEWSLGVTALATVHNAATGALELWAGDSTGNVYRLLNEAEWQDAGADFAPTLTTQIHRPAGIDGRARLTYLRLIVNDAAETWTGKIALDEKAVASGDSFTFTASDHRFQSSQGRELRWTPPPTNRHTANAFQYQITFPSANKALYISLFEAVYESDLEYGAQQ
jgi:hypothetical protein